MSNTSRPITGLSRRNFLKSSGVVMAASGLGLAGCRSGPSGDAEDSGLSIPSQGASLPDGDVTFRWVDTGDLRATYWEKFFIPAWSSTHSNITFAYDALPAQSIAETVPLGIRNGSVQDVFALPPTISMADAVAEGWLLPLDDIIPNFTEWKSAFPEGLFFEGLNVLDGKTYSPPIVPSRNYGTALYFNRRLMEEAGYDPSSQQLSYEEYRDAARKVTEQGQGQAFGVTFGAEPRILQRQIENLAVIAGRPSEEQMDLRTGEFIYTSDEVLEAVELYAAMNADGSFFPGVASLKHQDAYASFPQGNAAMIFTGQWVIPPWQEAGFEFGVGPMPIPAGVDPLPLTNPPIGGPAPFVYADTPYPEVAGEILSYLGSPEGVRIWSAFVALGVAPTWPDILSDEGDPEVQRALELAGEAGVNNQSPEVEAAVQLAESTVAAPVRSVRNPELAKVSAVMESPTPGFGEVIQAMLVGEISDIPGALKDLQDRSDKALDEAIATVQQRGGKVSRDDYAFPNYDPTKSFGPEDYEAL